MQYYIRGMEFDANRYSKEIAEILSLCENGHRLMPLTRGEPISAEARDRIRQAERRRTIMPAVASGLYLYFDCWAEAHETAQDIVTAEGSFWHAIVHRREPDPGNAGYWFGRVGNHPIFPALRDAAAALGVNFGPRWNPMAFVDFCERAIGGELEQQAREVQRAEWQLLFDSCAR